MSDPRSVRRFMPGEIIEYEADDMVEIRAYMNRLAAQQSAFDRSAALAPYMGGLLGGDYRGYVTTLAAMQNTPPAPPSPKCSYCGRRVVSLDGKRDATCGGCGAAT